MGVEVDPSRGEGDLRQMHYFFPSAWREGRTDLSDDSSLHPEVTWPMNPARGFNQCASANQHSRVTCEAALFVGFLPMLGSGSVVLPGSSDR